MGVETKSTLQEIQNAYEAITKEYHPDNNPSLFKKLSEAYVILSNHKSRDAYDSLLKSRRTSFINDPEVKVKAAVKKSYIAERKEQA